MQNREDIQSVNRQRRCQVCDGNHKCSFKNDGLLFCGRRTGPQPGFRWLGECHSNPLWHLYRVADDLHDLQSGAPRSARKAAERDWGLLARQSADYLDTDARQALVAQLGVPAWTFDELAVGFNPAERAGGCWIFPERDGQGRVIGLMRRFADGQQRAQPGGKRGVYVPHGWQSGSGPLFLVEGASDTLALTGLGLAALGRPSCTGGVEPLFELLRQVSAERGLLVVGENDARMLPQGTLWPGRDGARQTALELQQRLQRRVLWTLPPDTCKDVRAWVLAQNLPTEGQAAVELWTRGGAELCRRLTEAARVPQSDLADDRPLPLVEVEPEPPFPLEVLPAALVPFVREAAQAIGCDASFVAVPLLACASAALGNAWELAITDTHVQTAALFTLIVGHPGSGKSPAFQLVTAPLRRLEQEAVAVHLQALLRWEALPEDLRGRPPLCPRLLLDDFTIEAMAPLLEHNPKGLLIIKDELAGLINALNQYRGGKGHDRQVLLSLWAGADLVIDRKGRKDQGPILVRRPFVAIAGGIQPGVLERLRGSDRRPVANDGLLDRFLFAFPALRPTRGEDWSVVSAAARNVWERAVTRLHREQPRGLPLPEDPSLAQPVLMPLHVQLVLRAAEEAQKPWEPRRLVLADDARPRWQAFTELLAAQACADDFPECLQGVWSKLRGYGARLALVLEALAWAVEGSESGNGNSGKKKTRQPPTEVSAAAVDGTGSLIAWFQFQARKVHALLTSDVRHADAERVLRWLAAHAEVHVFTRRDVWQGLRKTFLRPAHLDAPLLLLSEHRYLIPERVGAALRFHVNPLWTPRQF